MFAFRRLRSLLLTLCALLMLGHVERSLMAAAQVCPAQAQSAAVSLEDVDASVCDGLDQHASSVGQLDENGDDVALLHVDGLSLAQRRGDAAISPLNTFLPASSLPLLRPPRLA